MEKFEFDDWKCPEEVKPYIADSRYGHASVWVGTYHKYNCGYLCGVWIDLEECGDKETFYDVCRMLHYDEKDPEFMFNDYECFPEKFYGESGLDWDGLEEWMELDEDDREKVEAYWKYISDSSSVRDILGNYIGHYEDEEDYAREFLESTGDLQNLPDIIRNNIDWKGVTRSIMDDVTNADGFFFYE